MSKLTEYLALLPKAIENPKEVIAGWKNVLKEELGLLAEEELEEVLRRRLICASCPFMSANAKLNGYKTARVEDHCILCACPIKAKTANMNSICGIDLHNKTHPNEDQLEVKWYPYESTKS